MPALRRTALPLLGALALVVTAGCADPQPSPDARPVTGELSYAVGDVQGRVVLVLDGTTAVLSYSSHGGEPTTESRPQDRDTELIEFLRSVRALDGQVNELSGGTDCMDAGSGSLRLTIGEHRVSESFDCVEAAIPLDAMAVAGFDTDAIIGGMY